MNDPEYILTDEMELVASAVKTAAGLSALNYQHGYVEELNETLKQFEENPAGYEAKFPLFWFAEPYKVRRGIEGIYGIATADIFLINSTDKTWKAKDRMANNYKPLLFPLYRKTLDQFVLNPVFDHRSVEQIQHTLVKGYYWGEGQKSVLNDAVDCLKIEGIMLRVSNNQNCSIISNI